MARGITGLFETWREGVPYACMRGDIEAMAGLTLEESSTKTPRFKRWQPHPHSQDAISSASGSAPARESHLGGRVRQRYGRINKKPRRLTLRGSFSAVKKSPCQVNSSLAGNSANRFQQRLRRRFQHRSAWRVPWFLLSPK